MPQGCKSRTRVSDVGKEEGIERRSLVQRYIEKIAAKAVPEGSSSISMRDDRF